MQFINIDELTDEEIKPLDEDIQPIIGKLQYVQNDNIILYYDNSSSQRTIIPSQYYSISECRVTWHKDTSGYSDLDGKRCYFSAT